MKVGIVTLFDNSNYGNRLQNYAVSSFLKSMGIRTETLIPPRASDVRMVEQKDAFTEVAYKYSPLSVQNDDPRYVKRLRFKKFNEEHIMTVSLNSTRVAREFTDRYDFFVVGSDQVWNPLFRSTAGKLDYFLLDFVPDHKRVCFSPSFGVDMVPEQNKEIFAQELSKYRALSVREKSGARIIKDLTGRDAEVLLDPTLTIKKEEWASISKPLLGFDYSQEYVLYYFLGDKETEMSAEARAAVAQQVKKRGLREYQISDPDDPMMNSLGPAEFLNLFKNASLICTDSFHGTVFSLLFERPFLLFDRILMKQGKPCDMSSRTTTLLNTICLTSKFPRNQSFEEKDIWDNDYSKQLEIIDSERERTVSFLRKSMSFEKQKVPETSLSNGMSIPVLGLGAGILADRGPHVEEKKYQQRSIYEYASAKYKRMLFDVSINYGLTEGLLGEAMDFSCAREDSVFCVKISNQQQREGDIERAFERHLELLRTDYIDILMLHWPLPGHFVDSYRQMEKLLEKGKVGALGVSNFHKSHLKTLFAQTSVVPSVNQIEVHPLFSQEPLVKYCKKKGITVMGYTPFGRMHDAIRSNKTLRSIATKKGKSIPQIILRWLIQREIIPLPQTKSYAHFDEFMDVFTFELSEAEMKEINKVNENVRLRYNPDTVDYEMV